MLQPLPVLPYMVMNYLRLLLPICAVTLAFTSDYDSRISLNNPHINYPHLHPDSLSCMLQLEIVDIVLEQAS